MGAAQPANATSIPREWANASGGAGNIGKISFQGDVFLPQGAGLDGLFAGCSNLAAIENLYHLDTSNVASMASMFAGCSEIAAIDLSTFDTSNVTNMKGMLSGCSSLELLNLGAFDTSKVTNLDGLFAGCSSLESLDLSSFEVSAATTASGMLENTGSLGFIKTPKIDDGRVVLDQARALFAQGGWWYDVTDDPAVHVDVDQPDAVRVNRTYEADKPATLSYGVALAGGGTVSSQGETFGRVWGAPVGSEALADPGYRFVGWTDAGGTVVSADALLVPAKPGDAYADASYAANFKELDPVALSYAAAEGGSVSSPGELLNPETGAAQGATATADPGWAFVGWFDESGTKVSGETRFVPQKDGGAYHAATYTATFAEALAPKPAPGPALLVPTGDSALPMVLAVLGFAALGALATAAARRRRG